jgi:quercetin 2,3-dioxygenase
MTDIRKVVKVIRSKPTIEGAGVHLNRVFGFTEVNEFDPFLLLDDFRSDDPKRYIAGFPWHPHRGIETITYMLEGRVVHGDSMGNKGVIGPCDLQWMTAGSGIIHQEMPEGDEKDRMGGFQLWANLPASHKMMEPRYREIKSEEIPEVKIDDGISVKVICGEVDGTPGPIKDIVTQPEYLDIHMEPGRIFTRSIASGRTVFAYCISGKGLFGRADDPFDYTFEGSGYFDMKRDPFISNGTVVKFGDGEQVSIRTKDEPVQFLLISGKPLNEPVAWYGPIVMNTRKELRIAFEEYEKGTFVKAKS